MSTTCAECAAFVAVYGDISRVPITAAFRAKYAGVTVVCIPRHLNVDRGDGFIQTKRACVRVANMLLTRMRLEDAEGGGARAAITSVDTIHAGARVDDGAPSDDGAAASSYSYESNSSGESSSDSMPSLEDAPWVARLRALGHTRMPDGSWQSPDDAREPTTPALSRIFLETFYGDARAAEGIPHFAMPRQLVQRRFGRALVDARPDLADDGGTGGAGSADGAGSDSDGVPVQYLRDLTARHEALFADGDGPPPLEAYSSGGGVSSDEPPPLVDDYATAAVVLERDMESSATLDPAAWDAHVRGHRTHNTTAAVSVPWFRRGDFSFPPVLLPAADEGSESADSLPDLAEMEEAAMVLRRAEEMGGNEAGVLDAAQAMLEVAVPDGDPSGSIAALMRAARQREIALHRVRPSHPPVGFAEWTRAVDRMTEAERAEEIERAAAAERSGGAAAATAEQPDLTPAERDARDFRRPHHHYAPGEERGDHDRELMSVRRYIDGGVDPREAEMRAARQREIDLRRRLEARRSSRAVQATSVAAQMAALLHHDRTADAGVRWCDACRDHAGTAAAEEELCSVCLVRAQHAAEKECTVCRDRARCLAMAPCGHTQTCVACAMQCLKGEELECPICRGKVSSVALCRL